MVKKQYWGFLLFLSLSLLFNELKSQEASFVFNRTSFSVFNPAFTGSEGSIVSFNRRTQWSNVEGAPRTNFLIYHMPKKKNGLKRSRNILRKEKILSTLFFSQMPDIQ